MANKLKKDLGRTRVILQHPKTGALDAFALDYQLTDLCYDVNTKVVYYFALESHHVSSPYISENGKYCRFIDGQIVEIP